jgi:hypothetical protein
MAPSKYQNLSSLVSYTNRPVAGEEMAVLWAVVSRGVRNPLSVASRSKTALGSGVEVPIPILSWAMI